MAVHREVSCHLLYSILTEHLYTLLAYPWLMIGVPCFGASPLYESVFYGVIFCDTLFYGIIFPLVIEGCPF